MQVPLGDIYPTNDRPPRERSRTTRDARGRRPFTTSTGRGKCLSASARRATQEASKIQETSRPEAKAVLYAAASSSIDRNKRTEGTGNAWPRVFFFVDDLTQGRPLKRGLITTYERGERQSSSRRSREGRTTCPAGDECAGTRFRPRERSETIRRPREERRRASTATPRPRAPSLSTLEHTSSTRISLPQTLQATGPGSDVANAEVLRPPGSFKNIQAQDQQVRSRNVRQNAPRDPHGRRERVRGEQYKFRSSNRRRPLQSAALQERTRRHKLEERGGSPRNRRPVHKISGISTPRPPPFINQTTEKYISHERRAPGVRPTRSTAGCSSRRGCIGRGPRGAPAGRAQLAEGRAAIQRRRREAHAGSCRRAGDPDPRRLGARAASRSRSEPRRPQGPGGGEGS